MNISANNLKYLKILIGISLNTKIDNVRNMIIEEKEDCINILFYRLMNISDLRKINKYFNCNFRNGKLHYVLKISKDMRFIRLNINDNYFMQQNIINNNEIDTKLNEYNAKISNKINKFSSYIWELLYPTTEYKDYWTFYYISTNRTHIGFANKTKNSNNSYKISISNNNIDFYNEVYNVNCTENEAAILCLKRNYNSKFCSNWKICKYNTPINELIY